MENTDQKLRELIAKHLHVDIAKVTDEARMIDDLGADSLDTVELVMEIEEVFGIEINDQNAQKLVTVGDALLYVRNNVK